MHHIDLDSLLTVGRKVLDLEANAINHVKSKLDQQFIKAIELILNTSGRVVVTGMGKSGHIGNKIAATLASTGTPAFFVHPGEASHGDLGMITAEDTVLAISNSGESSEVLALLPMIVRFNIKLIAMTGNPNSTIAKQANIHLDIGVEQEACPLGLAPTSSTTATLAVGDALAIAALEARGFTKEDFALSHPGGALGKRLLLRVKDLMHAGDRLPIVSENTSVIDSLLEITNKGLGMTCVVDAQQQLLGIFTDGDIRRTLTQNLDLTSVTIKQVMSKQSKTIGADILAAKALEVMENHKITALVVLGNNSNKPIGIIHMHDLLAAGIA